MYRKFAIATILVLAASVLLVPRAADAQSRNIALCRRMADRCEPCVGGLGQADNGVVFINNYCRREVGTAWRNITRCQLVHATCMLTIVKCDQWTCRNIRDAFR